MHIVVSMLRSSSIVSMDDEIEIFHVLLPTMRNLPVYKYTLINYSSTTYIYIAYFKKTILTEFNGNMLFKNNKKHYFF